MFLNFAFSQTPCILGDVYVSEGANRGVPSDYIEIVNNGSNECSLSGFHLDDSEDLEVIEKIINYFASTFRHFSSDFFNYLTY